jgi:glycosyltransferase involved in cell wall biosynthesis
VKPRLLLVGRYRYRLPLEPGLRQKFDALREVLDVRVLASAADGSSGDETFELAPPFPVRPLDGLAFYAALPWRTARELRRFRPDAVLVQGAHEAALVLGARRLAGSPARIVLDLHGDWRAATRLYGSPLRRLLSPVADRLALVAIRHVDSVRTVSGYTTSLVRELGVEPAGTFPAFMDLEPFVEQPPVPLPAVPTALFVGVLEHYKGIEELAAAWRNVSQRLPEARLRIVGRGSRAEAVQELVRDLPERVESTPELSAAGVAAALDAATVLVLPSRSEGMGRVLVEAFCRGRGVVATRVGGIRDLVEDGVNGLLVEPRDPEALATALVSALSEEGLAQRLGMAARNSADPWLATPEQFAERMRALVDPL